MTSQVTIYGWSTRRLAWWAAVRMGGRARPTPTPVKLYDRVIVPLVRASERRFDPPFGQSVICVARVPEQ
jgi:hypothetical protein